MEFIQIAGIIFAVFALTRGFAKFKKKEMRTSGFAVWSLIWLGVIVIAVHPGSTSFFANLVGIGRGIDLVVYLSILLLYYLGFRLYIKMEDTNKEITRMVREIAFKEKKK
jgi:hypothetical protein